jgi:hypothetical protein
VGTRLSGAARRQRAYEEGRRRAQRAGRVERIYAIRGFDSIPGDDLRGHARPRWPGLSSWHAER